MQAINKKYNNMEQNNISKISIKSHKKKRTRKKIFWSEREEKTLFILQMALGTKFSIIKTFLKDKTVNDIKNHFYSKLRTYLSIQISKLKAENFFKEIDQNSYSIRKILSLVLSNKIPTMILNKNVIKELILDAEQKKKNKRNDNLSKDKNKEEKKDETKLRKKRGRPRINSKKDEINKTNKSLRIKRAGKMKGKSLFYENGKNEGNINGEIFKENNLIEKNEELVNKSHVTIELDKYNEVNNYEDKNYKFIYN